MLELSFVYKDLSYKKRWRIRKQLYEMQRAHCHYCGRFMKKPIHWDMNGATVCTVEHLDPIPVRVSLDPYVERVVAACYTCNNKADKEFQKTPVHRLYEIAMDLVLQQKRTGIDVFPVPEGWLVPKPPKPPKGKPPGKKMKDRIKKWESLKGRCGCCGEKMKHPMENRKSVLRLNDPVRDDVHILVHKKCKAIIDQSKAGLQINPV